MHQSSAISKHSLIQDVQSFIEGLRMSSAQDFPVNRGQLQGNEMEKRTNETSGLTPFAVYKSSDPNMSFSKMSLDSLAHDPTAAYAAGLIDGEGHIGIMESKNRLTSYYYVEVTVGMSDKARPMLEALHEEFGGTVNHGRKESEKWAASMKWRIGGESAIAFLQRVQPFLMLKREQATTALELGKIVATLPVAKERKTWTAEARKKAAALKKEMHKLNKKGPDALNAGAGWYKPQQTLFGTLEKFSGTWPKAGIASDGVVYLRPSWERRINENDSGLWPTPSANKTTRNGEIVNPDGTPWDGIQKPHSATTGKPIQTALTDAVKYWATPQARDYRTGEAHRWDNPNRSRNLNDQVGGRLNPDWADWLMGFPVGLTDLKPLAMDKFRLWQQQHGIS